MTLAPQHSIIYRGFSTSLHYAISWETVQRRYWHNWHKEHVCMILGWSFHHCQLHKLMPLRIASLLFFFSRPTVDFRLTCKRTLGDQLRNWIYMFLVLSEYLNIRSTQQTVYNPKHLISPQTWDNQSLAIASLFILVHHANKQRGSPR